MGLGDAAHKTASEMICGKHRRGDVRRRWRGNGARHAARALLSYCAARRCAWRRVARIASMKINGISPFCTANVLRAHPRMRAQQAAWRHGENLARIIAAAAAAVALAAKPQRVAKSRARTAAIYQEASEAGAADISKAAWRRRGAAWLSGGNVTVGKIKSRYGGRYGCRGA